MSQDSASTRSPPPAGSQHVVDMNYLVRALIKYNASDLHLKVGRPPLYRINGRIIATKMADLTEVQVGSIISSVLTKHQRAELEENRQADLSFQVGALGRFRCNVYYQRGSISAAIRMIPVAIPRVEDLGIPEVLKDLVTRPRGLLLVTGATGSGKSTTLASLVQYLNETCSLHILTIEDPIEFVHRDIKASITQREVGSDTHGLKDALYAGLRQDPDVIMIGELRDFEMIQGALTAAETGHLVLATLHTNDAKSTIDRIIDVFPPAQQNQARIQLASTLVGVVSQQLVVKADGRGQVAACEVMVKSPVIEDYILRNELERIPAAISASGAYYKMQSMSMALERLANAGLITVEEALKSSNNPDDLRMRLSGVSRDQGYDAVAGGSTDYSGR